MSDDVRAYLSVPLRAGLGCGATLAAGVFATVVAVAAVLATGGSLSDVRGSGWLTVLWRSLAVAAVIGAAAAVISPRLGGSLERSLRTSWLGCVVPLVVVVVGFLGMLALPFVGGVVPHPGANVGQGIAFGFFVLCAASLAPAIVAVFHPRLGIALGALILGGWLVAVYQAYH